MIGQHPQLAGLPELKLFCYETLGELEASLPRYWRERGVTHRSPGLVRAIAEYKFRGQTAEGLNEARAWLGERGGWPGSLVLDSLLRDLAPREAVEKSPDNVASDEALERLSTAYPNARYLHLTRHPVTTQRSAAEHWNRLVPGRPIAGEPMAGMASWVETHARILRFTGTLAGDRWRRVRAEDILNRPEGELRTIAEWLEIRTDVEAVESMMHPELSPFARFGPEGSGAVGGNDPGFLANPKPRTVTIPEGVGRPRGWVANEELWRMTVDLAGRLGYS